MYCIYARTYTRSSVIYLCHFSFPCQKLPSEEIRHSYGLSRNLQLPFGLHTNFLTNYWFFGTKINAHNSSDTVPGEKFRLINKPILKLLHTTQLNCRIGSSIHIACFCLYRHSAASMSAYCSLLQSRKQSLRSKQHPWICQSNHCLEHCTSKILSELT